MSKHQTHLEGLLKHRLLAPPSGFLIQKVWGGGQELAFLICSQVMSCGLRGSSMEKHCLPPLSHLYSRRVIAACLTNMWDPMSQWRVKRAAHVGRVSVCVLLAYGSVAVQNLSRQYSCFPVLPRPLDVDGEQGIREAAPGNAVFCDKASSPRGCG